jgi:hypothetical protein
MIMKLKSQLLTPFFTTTCDSRAGILNRLIKETYWSFFNITVQPAPASSSYDHSK